MKNILIVGAHPDDIELGMGGASYQLVQQGHKVFWYHTTNGVYTDLQNQPVRDSKEIFLALNDSAVLLEAELLWGTDLPEATALTVSKHAISQLQTLLKEHHIDTIFTHPAVDTYHQDHIATHHIVMAAARRYVHNLFFFESIFNYADGLLQPTMYIGFDKKVMGYKLGSLINHTSEYEKFGGQKWLDQIEAMARFRGAQIEMPFAEAFIVQKMIGG